jgi:predicted MFS family arabinose efflux permease
MRLRAMAGGLAPAVSAGWNVSNVGAAATVLAHAYGVSLAVVGLFTTALFITHAASQVPGGHLCDRFGARSVGIAGLCVIVVASLVALTWRDAWFVIGVRFVTGIGTGLAFVAASDYIRTTVGTPVAQGIFGGVSVASGGAALAIVSQFSGWRSPFLSAAVVAAAGIVVLAASPVTRDAPRPARGSASVFRDPLLTRFGLMHSASFGLAVVVGNWVVTLLQRAGHDSKSVAGIAGALVLALGIISRPVGSRAYGNVTVLRASFVVVGFALLVLAAGRPLGLMFAATGVIGLATGVPFASAFTGAARARPDAPAAAVGYVNTLAALTVLIGTPLLGLSFSLTYDGRIGFVVVAVLAAAAAAAVPRRFE